VTGTGCGKDFSGLAGFDAHRVGAHGPGEYRGDIGECTHELGRRCLNEDELREIGYDVDDRGLWYSVAERERARRNFGEPAGAIAGDR
jgi:hypothetical protein